MKCENCGSEEFAYLTMNGTIIPKEFKKRERTIKTSLIVLFLLLIGPATLNNVLSYIAVFNVMAIMGVFIYYKIRKKRLPKDHIEMVCKQCGERYVMPSI